MQLGYFTMPLHPPGRNYLETLKEDREAIILADRLGFVEAYVGEHTTDLAETIPSCLMFLASLVHATHRIKLCTGTLNLPNGHPAAFAANVAMLDHMLEGRLIVGISPGGLPSDMEMFENLDRDRKAMFLECINHMIALWTTDAPYDIKGQFWNLSTERTLRFPPTFCCRNGSSRIGASMSRVVSRPADPLTRPTGGSRKPSLCQKTPQRPGAMGWVKTARIGFITSSFCTRCAAPAA
jgi:hypothetical protein